MMTGKEEEDKGKGGRAGTEVFMYDIINKLPLSSHEQFRLKYEKNQSGAAILHVSMRCFSFTPAEGIAQEGLLKFHRLTGCCEKKEQEEEEESEYLVSAFPKTDDCYTKLEEQKDKEGALNPNTRSPGPN